MPIKLITTITAALFVASFGLSATAEAGCGGKRGYSKSYSTSSSYKAKQRAKARARARARLAAKKRAQKKAAQIAKAKAEERTETTETARAQSKGNFTDVPSTTALLTSGDINTAETQTTTDQIQNDTSPVAKEGAKIASTATGGCTRFVPAVGRTISVSCE